MLTMTILQGLPGSGKSRLAQAISRDRRAEVMSADDYPGLYTANPDGGPPIYNFPLIGAAHGWCFRRTIEAVQAGRHTVIDNTHLNQCEVAPYILLAQAYGVDPRVVRVVCDPEVALARNTHGVPRVAYYGRPDSPPGMIAQLAAYTPAPHWRRVPGYTTSEMVSDAAYAAGQE